MMQATENRDRHNGCACGSWDLSVMPGGDSDYELSETFFDQEMSTTGWGYLTAMNC